MAVKELWMILHVDLQCPSCYKKIKEILCEFPQIRDQAYYKTKNLVKISVVCCRPEKIRDKLCCKGGKVIKSIEIVPKVAIIEPEPKDAEKDKETLMRVYVDLQCASCYKKIKKILCKFPQIRDQVYDEKNNLVKITVVCCSPEKIRDELCCEGGKVIKSIEIVGPAKPKEPEKPKSAPEKAADKPKDAQKPEVTFKEPEKPPKEAPEKPKDAEKAKPAPEKPKEAEKDKPKDSPKPAADPPKPPVSVPGLVPVPVIPPPQLLVIPPPQPPVVVAPAELYPVPVEFCYPQCYEGHGGDPCYFGYGRPVPPPPSYDNYYQGYGYNKGWYVSRCDDYFSEANTSGCRIM